MSTPAAAAPLVEPGDVLLIPEAHYCYGPGDLVMRVTAVDTTPPHPRLEWLVVHGIRLWDGRDVGERTVDVRVAAIRDGRVRRVQPSVRPQRVTGS